MWKWREWTWLAQLLPYHLLQVGQGLLQSEELVDDGPLSLGGSVDVLLKLRKGPGTQAELLPPQSESLLGDLPGAEGDEITLVGRLQGDETGLHRLLHHQLGFPQDLLLVDQGDFGLDDARLVVESLEDGDGDAEAGPPGAGPVRETIQEPRVIIAEGALPGVEGDGQGRPVGPPRRLGLSPATDGARIFAASHEGRVSAFDATSGKRLWSVDTRLPLSAGPGFGDGLLALGTNDGDLLALDATNGEQRWLKPIGSEVLASPAIGSGVVAVRSVDGRLRGFASDDGGALWSVDQSVPRLILRGNARPVIAGVTVVAGFDNGRLGAYDLATGEAAWEFAVAAPKGRTELDRLVDISAGVKVVGDDVYAVGYNGRLIGVALESGQALWQRELSSYSGLDADWNNVYVTDEAGEVVAVARNSGRPVWRQDGLRRRDVTAPTPYQEAVVVGDFEGYLHWLSAADGSMLARTRGDGSRISSPPLVVGDLLYAQSDGGSLTAFAIVPPKTER